MGGSVIVENKGGGGGNIGMGYVARADADGYTILLSTSAFSVNPGLYNAPVYDPFKDFAAICELAVSPHVFAVKPDLGVSTMKEFVTLAKRDPDKFNVSTPPMAPRRSAGRGAEAARRVAEDGDHRLPGGGDALRRDLRHGAALVRRAGAGASAIKAGNIKASRHRATRGTTCRIPTSWKRAIRTSVRYLYRH